MAKVSKNKSRELDIVETPEYLAQRDAIQGVWREDFERFCAEKLKIVNKLSNGGSPVIPFVWNDCQKALNKLVEDIGDYNEARSSLMHDEDPRTEITRLPIEVVVLKSRKVGVSTWCEARAYWKACLWPEHKCLVMAHERPAAQNIANIAQKFDIYWDPNEYPIVKVPLQRMSDDLLEWVDGHGSSIVVETSGTKGTGGSSRSFSYHFQHFSEMAFYTPDSPQLAAALKARQTYFEAFYESTANGTGNLFHDDWSNAMYYEDVIRLFQEGKPFPKWWNGKFRFFWPWHNQDENRRPLLKREKEYLEANLTQDEQELIDELDLDLEQIAWRRAQIAGPCSKQNLMTPEQFFKQEEPSTPEEAFVAKADAIFDVKKLNLMSEESKKIKPVFCGFLMHDDNEPTGIKEIDVGTEAFVVHENGPPTIEGAQYVVWERPEPRGAYVIGADAAEGLEHGDWSTVSVHSRTNGTVMKEVARFRAKTPAYELGDIVNYLGLLYNDAYVVGERNPPGNAMMERLVQLGYTNLYHHRNIETVTNHDNPEAFTAGFRTTPTTKPMICERGVAAIRDDEVILRHPDAIREWKMFARVDKKYGAPEGENDDTVIADLLALFGMSEAPPLHHTQVTLIDTEKLTAEELNERYLQQRVKEVRERARKQNQFQMDLLLQRNRFRSAEDALMS